MLNGLIDNRDELVAFYDELIGTLTDVSAFEEQRTSLEAEAAAFNKDLHDWIMENARHAMAKEVYDARFDELEKKLIPVKEKLERINDEILRRGARKVNALETLRVVKESGPVTEFDAELFGVLVDTVTVYSGRMVFRLKDGSERTV